MKKKILLILSGIGVIALLYIFFVPAVTKKDILINAPVIRVQHQLSAIKSISRWYLPFAGTDTASIKISGNNKIATDTDSLVITSLTGLRAVYQVTEKGASKDFVFDVFADTAGQSKVTLSYHSTLWSRLTGSSAVTDNAIKSLQHLKEFFEDTKKMYGFEMEVVQLTDTAFLFTSKIVSNSNKKETFKSLYEALIQNAAQKDMGYTGTKIFYTSPYGNDSIHIFTSIGISNPKNAPLEGEFSLKKMPYKGRLLSAYYQGSFKNINAVIKAMEQFKSDNAMTSMAIPFIKPITEGIDFDDAQIIQARAYYPVY
jgi:effector-binding domain-containing protein